MKPIVRILAGPALLALAACASVTPYQPLEDGVGYSEQKLESDRWRVLFNASARTAQAAVDDYLLYRAAELTLDNGFDWFEVTDRSLSGAPASGSPVSIGVGGYGGSYGSGIGIGFGTGVGDGPPWQAMLTVLMHGGAKPADNPKAYDARAVRDSLGSRIERPPPAAPEAAPR